MLVCLEGLVRVLHLYTEDPPRFIDSYGVEKRVPNHTGYAVTGNRNQNYSKFSINNSGFNSHREFTPSKDKIEIAIIGDSFIEGFHQDFDDSLGNKIEDELKNNIEVYEYGYAGYDMANQMHLIHAYKEDFEKIDHIVLYLNYKSDLGRSEYTPNTGRIAMLSSLLFKLRDNIKLLSYTSKIGILDSFKKMLGENNKDISNTIEGEEAQIEKEELFLNNFKQLVKLYGFDNNKTHILLDSRKTSASFLNYCKENGMSYIDFSEAFEESDSPTTLVYDKHWNNNGRELIASIVSEYFITRSLDTVH